MATVEHFHPIVKLATIRANSIADRPVGHRLTVESYVAADFRPRYLTTSVTTY